MKNSTVGTTEVKPVETEVTKSGKQESRDFSRGRFKKEYIDKAKFYSLLGEMEQSLFKAYHKATDPEEKEMWSNRISELFVIKYAVFDYVPDKIEQE